MADGFRVLVEELEALQQRVKSMGEHITTWDLESILEEVAIVADDAAELAEESAEDQQSAKTMGLQVLESRVSRMHGHIRDLVKRLSKGLDKVESKLNAARDQELASQLSESKPHPVFFHRKTIITRMDERRSQLIRAIRWVTSLRLPTDLWSSLSGPHQSHH